MGIAVVLAVVVLPIPLEPFAKSAVQKSLPMLWKGTKGYAEVKSCFGCHNEAYPMIAFRKAEEAGFMISKEDREPILDHVQQFLDSNLENYKTGKGTGGQIDTAGWALLTLQHGGRKPNATTDAMAQYILGYKGESGHWRISSNRPPTQSSAFTTTYVAIAGLKHFAPEKLKSDAEKRIANAGAWLVKTTPKETEDFVYRLRGIHAANLDKKQIEKAAKDLLALQRTDGGWGQRPNDGTDAYATATAVIALVECGTLKTNAPEFRKAIRYLLSRVGSDGTWHVPTRANPIQKYFESGFPHEKDQFISMSASAWATAALCLILND